MSLWSVYGCMCLCVRACACLCISVCLYSCGCPYPCVICVWLLSKLTCVVTQPPQSSSWADQKLIAPPKYTASPSHYSKCFGLVGQQCPSNIVQMITTLILWRMTLNIPMYITTLRIDCDGNLKGTKGDICSNETMYQIKSSWSRMNITGLEFKFIMILPLWIIVHMSSGHVVSYDVKIDLFCSKVSLTWPLLRLQLSCNLQNSHYWQLKAMYLFVCFYFLLFPGTSSSLGTTVA